DADEADAHALQGRRLEERRRRCGQHGGAWRGGGRRRAAAAQAESGPGRGQRLEKFTTFEGVAHRLSGTAMLPQAAGRDGPRVARGCPLTTAASSWITAAIGILAGIGFYFPMALSVVLTLGVLSAFRWIEAKMPTQAYYHFDVRFARAAEFSERQIRDLVERHGFSLANF